jgi:hypothetical protein
MLPAFELSPRVSALIRPDWQGIRQALLRSIYATLLILVMLLPANFVAYALFSTLFRGNATGGVKYAALHHLGGYWVGSSASALAVGPLVWWAALTWEVLFWASCLSALAVLLLWSVRAVASKVARRAQQHETLDAARAA